jgi:hypothetical protein
MTPVGTKGSRHGALPPLESAALLAVVQWVAIIGKLSTAYRFRITAVCRPMERACATSADPQRTSRPPPRPRPMFQSAAISSRD